MSNWNALIQSATQHLVTSLSSNDFVTPTFFEYSTSFLTLHDFQNVGLARNFSGLCALPICSELRTQSIKSGIKEKNSNQYENKQNLKFTNGTLKFCCSECDEIFTNRKSEIENMKPLTFRDGILNLVQRSNPNIPIRKLILMKNKMSGKNINTIIKEEIVEKNPSSEESLTSSIQDVNTTFLNTKAFSNNDSNEKLDQINHEKKVKKVRFDDNLTQNKKIVKQEDLIKLQVKERNPKPPIDLIEAIKKGTEINLEASFIPNYNSEDNSLINSEMYDNLNSDIDDNNEYLSEDIYPLNDDINPIKVSMNSDKFNSRQIFFGFSDSDSDEDVEDENIDIKSYLKNTPTNFTIHQRLFISICRLMTPESANYLNRNNAKYKPHYINKQVVKEDEEIVKMRRAFELSNINPDAPRSKDLPTTSQLKKPTRKRKLPLKQIQATDPKYVNSSIEDKKPEIDEITANKIEQYIGTHIALNDPNYKRYQSTIKNFQRVIPKISRIMNLNENSTRKLEIELDSFISRMSHHTVPECINDKDWEILCIIFLQALQKAGSLLFEERKFDSVDDFVLMNYVIEKGLSYERYNDLLDTILKNGT